MDGRIPSCFQQLLLFMPLLMHYVVFHFIYLMLYSQRYAATVVTQPVSWPVLMHCVVCSVPFFVAAPTTTLDPNLPAGSDITIEHRPGSEVTHFQGKQVAPDGIDVSSTPHCPLHILLTVMVAFQWAGNSQNGSQLQDWRVIQMALLLQPTSPVGHQGLP